MAHRIRNMCQAGRVMRAGVQDAPVLDIRINLSCRVDVPGKCRSNLGHTFF